MKKDLSLKDWKILCAKSGNRCALPNCRAILVADETKTDKASMIAQAAHIKGENSGSARYDASMSEEERNCLNNRILLCPTCHTKIDAQPGTYPVALLQRYKTEHEAWVAECTKSEVINISFSELDVVTKHLISSPGTPNDSLTLIPPTDKIKKNGLSSAIEKMVLIGMTQVKQVASFVENMTAVDANFSNTLVNGFVTEYKRLYAAGIRGDDLFEQLIEFSCGCSGDFKQRAAGLSVLVYLFEKCDVFEK